LQKTFSPLIEGLFFCSTENVGSEHGNQNCQYRCTNIQHQQVPPKPGRQRLNAKLGVCELLSAIAHAALIAVPIADHFKYPFSLSILRALPSFLAADRFRSGDKISKVKNLCPLAHSLRRNASLVRKTRDQEPQVGHSIFCCIA